MVSAVDSSLQAYTQALEALYRKSWSQAAGLFATVVESSDVPELRERARQYLAACRVQEAHLFLGHTLCEIVEAAMPEPDDDVRSH